MANRALKRAAVMVSSAVLGVGGWVAVADANGTSGHGFTRSELSKVAVEDRVRIRTKGEAQVIVGRITVEPGGHTPWHYHPGPHIVSVVTGTVEVYETDCSVRTYEAGEGFYDPGSTHRPHVHTLRNPSPSATAEVTIVDIREDELLPTVVADPQPGACFT